MELLYYVGARHSVLLRYGVVLKKQWVSTGIQRNVTNQNWCGTMNRPLKTEMFFEWNWPTFWGWTHHITIFDFDISYQRDGDHSPGYHCCFIILNLKLLDFGYYNTHHAPDEDDDE